MKVLDGAVARLAAEQHGVFSRRQAYGAGASPGACDRRLASGAWERTAHPLVYRLAGCPETWRGRVMAAVLAGPAGTVASHRAAAALAGVWEGEPVEVTVPPRSSPRLASARVHQAFVAANDRGTVDGIPATRIERTLLDLASVVTHDDRLERAVEAALRQGLTNSGRLQGYLADAARPGRPGVARFRKVLGRCSGGRPTGSELEVRFLQLLRAAGMEEPSRQVEVRVEERRYFLDFAYPRRRVAIELDGRAHHGFEEDRRRQNALVLAGWTLLRFTWADVTERGEATVAAVARLVEAA